MTTVSVVIPVGPERHHCRWLGEALESVASQTRPPDEVILVDDMHDLDGHDLGWLHAISARMPFLIHRPTWRLGVAGAFNAGVGGAEGDLVFMLGADDRMLPRCLELCAHEFEQNRRADAYYYVGVRYLDDREDRDQTSPCGTAAVTRGLWRATGGFPLESAVGAPDSMLVSILMRHMPKALVGVAGGTPLVEYRPHALSDTASRGPWQGAIFEARDVITRTWVPPEWGRYE